jgi:leader peptidase (prepilin peptidase)/N-methyltransferase
MIRALRKTRGRACLFFRNALAWRTPERQYALVAWCLTGGVVWLVVSLTADPAQTILSLAGLYLIAILMAVCAIDARYGIIPNSLVVAIAAGGLMQICLLANSELLLERAFDAAVVWVAGCTFRAACRSIRGYDGLGLGDVKFGTAAVLWIGLGEVPALLLIAVFSAFLSLLILKTEGFSLSGKQAISFGPHLAMGLWLMWTLSPLH